MKKSVQTLWSDFSGAKRNHKTKQKNITPRISKKMFLGWATNDQKS